MRANSTFLKRFDSHPTHFGAINSKTLPLFQNILSIVIIVISAYVVFSVWNVDMTAWLASAGIVGIAQDEELVCKDPEPRVRFRRFSGSALDFELLVWIEKPALKGRIIDILNSQIFHQFKANDIEIPYSKQDLYIKEFPYR